MGRLPVDRPANGEAIGQVILFQESAAKDILLRSDLGEHEGSYPLVLYEDRSDCTAPAAAAARILSR